MKLGIFTAYRNFHKRYIAACETLNIPYEIIDILSPKWLQLVKETDCDGYLCRPPSKFEERNRLFDERLYFVNKILKYKIYPSYEELLLYENKRFSAYWLDFFNFPHPKTQVFYRKVDFINFIRNTKYPFIVKINTGTSAKGVKIVKNKFSAYLIANLTFGIKNNKLTIGYTPQKTGKIIPFPALGTIQKHHVITQTYKKIKWELC